MLAKAEWEWGKISFRDLTSILGRARLQAEAALCRHVRVVVVVVVVGVPSNPRPGSRWGHYVVTWSHDGALGLYADKAYLLRDRTHFVVFCGSHFFRKGHVHVSAALVWCTRHSDATLTSLLLFPHFGQHGLIYRSRELTSNKKAFKVHESVAAWSLYLSVMPT